MFALLLALVSAHADGPHGEVVLALRSDDIVHDLHVRDDGTVLAAVNRGGTGILLDSARPDALEGLWMDFPGDPRNQPAVDHLRFSPDGRLVVGWSGDPVKGYSAGTYDLDARWPREAWRVKKAGVAGAAASDSEWAWVAGGWLWRQPRDGKAARVAAISGAAAVAFQPDGSVVVLPDGPGRIIGPSGAVVSGLGTSAAARDVESEGGLVWLDDDGVTAWVDGDAQRVAIEGGRRLARIDGASVVVLRDTSWAVVDPTRGEVVFEVHDWRARAVDASPSGEWIALDRGGELVRIQQADLAMTATMAMLGRAVDALLALDLDAADGCRGDCVDGEGTLSFSDGGTIAGTFAGGKPTRGRLTMADGAWYDGSFVDARPHGRGRSQGSDGSTYDGEWQAGKRTGQGSGTFPDGNRFVGEWADDLPHGKGRFTWIDGVTYDGQLVEGKGTGRGIIVGQGLR